MKIEKKDFDWAVGQGLLSGEQAHTLWNAFLSRPGTGSKFDFAHVAYYFGAMIVISAMAWFMTLAWEMFGGAGIFLISLLYMFFFSLAGRTLWFKDNLYVPGGLLFTMAVCMTPLMIYGLERFLGFWPQGDPGSYADYHIWVKGSWFVMEIGTILAGLAALRFVKFPFLTAPIAFTLWYMSMDLTPLLFGKWEYSWEERAIVSICFGLLILLAAYLLDRRTEQDFSFWLYFFGMLSFWGGLTSLDRGSEWGRFLYCLVNLFLMILSVLLNRRVFIVFGSIGVFGYLGYLSHHLFRNSVFYPFGLTLLGILVIYLGVQYQKHRQRLEMWIINFIPPSARKYLPSSRESFSKDI